MYFGFARVRAWRRRILNPPLLPPPPPAGVLSRPQPLLFRCSCWSFLSTSPPPPPPLSLYLLRKCACICFERLNAFVLLCSVFSFFVFCPSGPFPPSSYSGVAFSSAQQLLVAASRHAMPCRAGFDFFFFVARSSMFLPPLCTRRSEHRNYAYQGRASFLVSSSSGGPCIALWDGFRHPAANPPVEEPVSRPPPTGVPLRCRLNTRQTSMSQQWHTSSFRLEREKAEGQTDRTG